MVTTFMRKVCKSFTFITIIITYLILFILSCGINNSVIEKPVAKATEVLEQTTRPQWEMEWERTIQAAKKEGKIVVYSSQGGDIRQALSSRFQEKYGIPMDMIILPGGQTSEKIVRERKSGLFLADVLIGGSTPFLTVSKPAGALALVEKEIILPEVKDPKLWWSGGLHFIDQDHTVIAFSA